MVLSPIHDEPGMAIPADLPPVGNASFPAVSARWVKYLQDQGLTPQLLGSKTWGDVMPSTAGGVTGSSIESRRLYYHSLRFVSWASSRYLANATRALESNLVTGAPIYVNWNNMAAHWYYPSTPTNLPLAKAEEEENKEGTEKGEGRGGREGESSVATGQINHDWFEFARERGVCDCPLRGLTPISSLAVGRHRLVRLCLTKADIFLFTLLTLLLDHFVCRCSFSQVQRCFGRRTGSATGWPGSGATTLR